MDKFPDSQKVGFSYPSGDYWRTELVGELKKAELQQVEYTGYHECFKIFDPEKNYNPDLEEVLIFS